MADHQVASFGVNADGFITAACKCGAPFPPFPDEETAIDALMAHAETAPRPVVWGDDVGVTWDNAPDHVKIGFALTRLFWFYRMVDTGGPDGSALDTEVRHQAREAAGWFGPVLEEHAGAAGMREPGKPS